MDSVAQSIAESHLGDRITKVNDGGASYQYSLKPKTVNNKKQLKLDFLNALTPLLEKEGFSLVSSKERYVRDKEDHRDELWIAFLEYGNELRVQPSAGIRFKQVEDAFHATSGFSEETQAWTSTVGTWFAVLKGESQAHKYQIPLISETQAPSAAEEFFKSYKEVAVPYFERWSTLKAIDAAINDDPSKRVPHLRDGMQWFRCSTGIIVAKIVGRPNFDELQAFYKDVISKDQKGFYLSRFNALLEWLSRDSV